MYKLNYIQGQFCLNDKADAFEAMNFILTQMHTWIQYQNKKLSNKDTKAMNAPVGDDIVHKLENMAAICCDSEKEEGA